MLSLKNSYQKALETLGIPASGIIDISDFENESSFLRPHLEAWKKWIDDGSNAKMTFMEENEDARKDHKNILKNARSVIVFLVPYSSGKKVREVKRHSKTEEPKLRLEEKIVSEDAIYSLISKYARSKDYHKVIKRNLEIFVETTLRSDHRHGFEHRVVIDSVPFFERAHAKESGLGFTGKNTMFIRPGLGSFFFIASLLVSIPASELCEPEAKKNPFENLSCGDCTKCLDACPTHALTEPYYLDANRCISYLSIEHRDVVDEGYLPHFAETLYGCDICQTVCPYNLTTGDFKRLKEFNEPHEPFTILSAADLAKMNQKQYETWFGGTAATRAKYGGLVRNAIYHLFATRAPELLHILDARENDDNPLIQKSVAQIKSLLKKPVK